MKGGFTYSNRIIDIIKQEMIFPSFRSATAAPDWKTITANVTQKFPKYAEEAVVGAKVMYYQSKKDWNNFQPAVMQYMNKYGNKATIDQMNNFAWEVFDHCKDKACITQALEWSKLSIKDKEEPNYMDTYANLLHKLGRTTEALAVEQKAMSLVPESEKASFQTNIEKMKKGEKTWAE
jgi:uncharacterized protein HemY